MISCFSTTIYIYIYIYIYIQCTRKNPLRLEEKETAVIKKRISCGTQNVEHEGAKDVNRFTTSFSVRKSDPGATYKCRHNARRAVR